MEKKGIAIIMLLFAIIMSFSAIARYETLAGIAADSPEYNNYKLCIDSCGQCETNCKTNTYRMAADMQQKAEFCGYLPEAEKTPCLNRIYMSKAITGKDSAECRKITDENEKQGCLLNVQTEKAITAENDAECSSLAESLAGSCKQAFYMRMASMKKDESYCDNLADENTKRACRDNVAMQIAINLPGAEPETTSDEGTPAESASSPFFSSKSLITYGIIILAVIIMGIIAVIIIKKTVKGKPQQPTLVIQQKQQGPPLILQKQPMPEQKIGETR